MASLITDWDDALGWSNASSSKPLFLVKYACESTFIFLHSGSSRDLTVACRYYGASFLPRCFLLAAGLAFLPRPAQHAPRIPAPMSVQLAASCFVPSRGRSLFVFRCFSSHPPPSLRAHPAPHTCAAQSEEACAINTGRCVSRVWFDPAGSPRLRVAIRGAPRGDVPHFPSRLISVSVRGYDALPGADRASVRCAQPRCDPTEWELRGGELKFDSAQLCVFDDLRRIASPFTFSSQPWNTQQQLESRLLPIQPLSCAPLPA